MTDPTVFSLPADLTIYQAQAVRDQLRAAWDTGVRRFDLGAISTIDGAGAQLLASLQRDLAQSGSATDAWLGEPQPDVHLALRLLGVRLG
jgi:anti-anti-sigma regulatory factor